jgi:hypothetical protein
MAKREKPPKKGEQITSKFLTDLDRRVEEPYAQRGHNRQVAEAGGMRKPLQPFLAIVTQTFSIGLASGDDDYARYGQAQCLFLDQATGEYDWQYGEDFICFSHHQLPLEGERIWVTWNEQSSRFEMLAGSPGQIIRFQFIEFFNESTLVASVLVEASDDGRMLGQTVQVQDNTDQQCFFGDETEAELVGRSGYACWMRTEGGSYISAVLEVFSLCCPPEGS